MSRGGKYAKEGDDGREDRKREKKRESVVWEKGAKGREAEREEGIKKRQGHIYVKNRNLLIPFVRIRVLGL